MLCFSGRCPELLLSGRCPGALFQGRWPFCREWLSDHDFLFCSDNENTNMKNLFIYVEGGRFHKFSHDDEKQKLFFLKRIVAGFYISKFPVTQRLYLDIMGNNPSNHIDMDAPVEMVTWLEAITFCNQLSLYDKLTPCYSTLASKVQFNLNSNGYRLPTEMEWEFAAKGGVNSNGFLYSGSNVIDEVAWYKNNSHGSSQPVGQKKPNELGVYDMSGNVWEWCWDTYFEKSNETRNEISSPTSGITKVYRGGSYLDFDYACTVTTRGHRPPNIKQSDIGFRIARSASNPK